jgi:hypothetical protein
MCLCTSLDLSGFENVCNGLFSKWRSHFGLPALFSKTPRFPPPPEFLQTTKAPLP